MLQGTSKEQIQVAPDNTWPEVSIMAPKDKENVQQEINLLASTSDPTWKATVLITPKI